VQCEQTSARIVQTTHCFCEHIFRLGEATVQFATYCCKMVFADFIAYLGS